MNLRLALGSLALASAAFSAHAELHDRGNGMIYDDVLNVTWLQDITYIQTSGYAPWAGVTHAVAESWVQQLTYGGFDDWRLPTVKPVNGVAFDLNWSWDGSTEYSFNISAPGSAHPGTTVNELAYMWYTTLGNAAAFTPTADYVGSSPLKLGPFARTSDPTGAVHFIWTGTQALSGPDQYFDFNIDGGGASYSTNNVQMYAWALRDGDIAPVPEPTTYGLLLAGLAVLAHKGRRQTQRR